MADDDLSAPSTSKIVLRRIIRAPRPQGLRSAPASAMTGDFCPLPANSNLFDLQELIGSGSFSQVYKATDKKTSTTIALKAYRTKRRNEDYYSRAVTEMAFLRFFDHPNIIKFIFAEIKTEYMCLAIEYSAEGSLYTLMQKEYKYLEPTVMYLMKQIMCAVCYLHSMHIMHGDIKPENFIVFYKENMIIKLSDFGLSDIIKTSEPNRKRAGSFFYMAPEILLGFPYDYTADIFSTGVLMHELLFNRRPFGKEISKEAYLALIKRRVTIEIPTQEKLLTIKCRDFLQKLLSYDKQDRPVKEAVTNHPFLNIPYVKSKQNHYMRACECLVKGIELVNAQEFASGYLEVKEAILHLKIHLNSIQDDDALLYYISNKYRDYVAYAALIEQRLLSDKATGPIDVGPLFQSERLRYLLKSTPPLLDAYDMCSVGEMYFMQRDRQQASVRLREGLDHLFPLVMDEPGGLRKHLLVAKMNQWIKIMETINRPNQPRPN